MIRNRMTTPAVLTALLALPAALPPAHAEQPGTRLDSVLVSAPRHGQTLRDVASTVQVIDAERIRNSPARSVTELLAENAIGFFSEWTPGQTSINIRGGATDGQGRDFRSQVTVLLNGRRAGTANISKLSLADIDRVEVIRGPASVIHGSQAIGGVINIVTRNGRNTTDSGVTVQGGSWGLVQGHAYATGRVEGVDFYAGLNGGRRGDYHTPRGELDNTAWQRYGGLLALGFGAEDGHRVDITLRSDGVYDAGFRGSQWDTNNEDDRFNQSIDAQWTARIGDWLNWSAQAYAFRDVDRFRWGSEKLRTGAPGYAVDNNRRQLTAIGTKITPQILLGESTDLLLGLDLESARLRSKRHREPMPGAAATQIAPFDNNENTLNLGLYGELVQYLFDNDLALRAGLRYSYGRLSTVSTPNQPLLDETTRSFDDVTYSLGAAYQAADWLKLRASVATGFRAPTASELSAEFTAVGGSQTIGNADLKPESSVQYEAGATIVLPGLFLDLALFQNTIEDRITTRQLTATRSQYMNAGADAVVRGLEAQLEYDAAAALELPMVLRLNASAVWNFDMKEKGAAPSLTGPHRDKIQRMYEYQAALGVTVGESRRWDLRGTAILRGPMYYDTEEALLIPQGEPNANYVHRKSPFWVFNLRANWYPAEGLTLFGGINNLFDTNRSTMFIATDGSSIANPVSSNGGLGNSNPGREFYVGASYRF